jgi:uroporphyrinogen-III synthase
VIELTATDVTPKPERETGNESEKPSGTREESRADSPAAARNASQSREQAARESKLLPILAGVIGLLAGALVLSLVVLFAGDGAKRLFASAPEAGANVPAASDFAALRSRADQLAQRQDEIAKQIGALAAQTEAQAKQQDVRAKQADTQAKEIDVLTKQADAQAREVKALDIGALRARLDAAEAAVKSAGAAAEQGRLTETRAREELAAKFAALDAQVKQAQARPAVANAAEVVALGALRDAIARGAPFTGELNAVRAMLGEAGGALAPFEPAAAKGLPTVADLRKRFTVLAPKLAHEPKNESGYFSRLMSNAGRLVEVRPIGEAAGDSAGAVVARIETRLANNDLAGALQEAAQLPAAAKVQAADWLADASRRREADVAVGNLLNAALTQPKAARNNPGQPQ